MKKVLLASTALVLSAGVAAADVSVGGDARMGILKSHSTDDLGTTSRIRISFSASGETDGGLTFGGSIRADNAAGGLVFDDLDSDGLVDIPGEIGGNAGGAGGIAGSVFVSGAFGTITMGDVSGAPEAAVGDASGVGLTGLTDKNELTYLSNSARPAVRWDYQMGDFGVHVSADNPSAVNVVGGAAQADTYGIAVTYGMNDISFGLGYEENDANVSHVAVGATAGFGDVTLKALYGTADNLGAADDDQYAFSLDYVMGATTVTGFYSKSFGAHDSFGVGMAYDLGGGASIKAGYVDSDANTFDAFDFGISMSF